jgi:hypothetical protein
MADKLKVVIVDPDGTHRSTEIENSLGGFQAAIGGGYIEGVFGREATVYVDEEGLLKNLPLNPLATLFAQRVLGMGVHLCGPALIVGPGDGEGNDTDVRPSVVEYFQKEN